MLVGQCSASASPGGNAEPDNFMASPCRMPRQHGGAVNFRRFAPLPRDQRSAINWQCVLGEEHHFRSPTHGTTVRYAVVGCRSVPLGAKCHTLAAEKTALGASALPAAGCNSPAGGGRWRWRWRRQRQRGYQRCFQHVWVQRQRGWRSGGLSRGQRDQHTLVRLRACRGAGRWFWCRC